MSKRGELLFLQDILDSSNAILVFTDGFDADKFSQNRLVYSATIRAINNLEFHNQESEKAS